MIKKFIKNNILLISIMLIWSLFHILFFGVNEVLKNADSFAYLQMSYNLKNLSIEWFWTWWFWFLYSFLIAIFDLITFSFNEYYVALSLNIILFFISAWILYKIWEFYLEKRYNLLLITLFYLSPILLHFNISVLSENIYIPLFLWLILFLIKASWNWFKKIKSLFFISMFISLLYLTRAEAFIYLWSIFIILFFYSIILKKIKINSIIMFSKNSILVVLFFFLLISPYLFYLHSITWEWGLTNKWSSNLRQAELRWSEKMDDEWFEQAVGELTPDNHHLKSWFVWWLKFDKWEKNWWLKDYLLQNPLETTLRIVNNQNKLYTKNLPELIVWDSVKLYYKSYLFLPILVIPLILVLFWAYKMFVQKKYEFLIIFFSFYGVASVFFTLFFVLNRYFLIFLPLFLVFMVYWLQNLKLHKIAKIIGTGTLLWIYIVWNYVYYNSVKLEDDKYEVKKVAWEFLHNLVAQDWKTTTIRIMERFPIVTYYSGTKERWITPFTENLENLIEYARFNQIDYLVVDTLDFKTYRPKLNFLLNNDFNNESLHKIKTIQVNNEKVILYKFSF